MRSRLSRQVFSGISIPFRCHRDSGTRVAGGALHVWNDCPRGEDEMPGRPEARGGEQQQGPAQRGRVCAVRATEPVAQDSDGLGRDDQVEDVTDGHGPGGECRAHMARREIQHERHAGADEEINGGYVSPEHDPGEPQRMGPVRDDRGDGRATGYPCQQPQYATRIQHEGPRQDPGGENGRQDPADQMNVTGDGARLGDVQPVGPQQKGRGPPDESPSPQRTHTACHDDVECRPLTPEEGERLRGRSLLVADLRIEPSALRLADGEEYEDAKQNTGYAERVERRAPPVGPGKSTRHVRGEPGTDGCAKSEYAQRHGTAPGGKTVRNDRGRGRGGPRLTDARTD